MIGKTNVGGGGGSGSAWAYIGVTYPSGSTCSATNGSTTLNAQGTSGLYVFQIPEPATTPETWTVSCTNGTNTKSASVSINTQYQVATVTLVYSRLPLGYQEVEYLESSGTQYFDLGEFNDLLNTEITLDYTLLAFANSLAVLGVYNSAGSVYLGRPSSNSPSTSKMSYWYTTHQNGNAVINERANVIVNNDNGEIVENEVVIGSATMSSNTTRRLYLFGISASSHVSARVYALSMRNKTTDSSILNYVPCYRTSDNAAGFYDLTSNAFVTGTGTFILGPDV